MSGASPGAVWTVIYFALCKSRYLCSLLSLGINHSDRERLEQFIGLRISLSCCSLKCNYHSQLLNLPHNSSIGI